MGLLDILFSSDDKSHNSKDRRGSCRGEHYGRSRSNWTDREDWDCGSSHHGGMSGFDSYEENDF